MELVEIPCFTGFGNRTVTILGLASSRFRAGVVISMIGAWTINVEDKPKPFPAGTQLLTMLLTAEPSKAEAAIQIGLDSLLLLAGIFAGEATPPTQFKPEHAQSGRAVLAKACEKAAQGLGVQVQLQLAKSLSWTPAKQYSLVGIDDASRRIQLQVLFTADWPKAAADANLPAAAAPKGVNVSMLEHVELDVTLRFGQRQLSLREIGELRFLPFRRDPHAINEDRARV